MKSTVACLVTLLGVAASAKAAPLCSAQDVREGKANLAGYKEAFELGAIPRTVYLDHERPVLTIRYCAGEISKGSFCRLMAANWREQMAIVRETFERPMRIQAFEKYSEGMGTLTPICGEMVD
jgi:hypothetical protein